MAASNEVLSAFVRFFVRDEVSGPSQDVEDAAESAADKIDRLAKAASEAGGAAMTKLGNGLKSAAKLAAGIGTAAAGAVAGIMAFTGAQEQEVENLGKLEAAYTAVGMTQEDARDSYARFMGLVGDSDEATEAAQDMANLAEAGGDVDVWYDIAAGTVARFGDALPISNMVESANESSRVGTLCGGMADAFNWAGDSAETLGDALGDGTEAQTAFYDAINEGLPVEDAMNAALATTADTTERQNMLQNTLNALYGETGQAYKQNNDALLKQREAQANMNTVLAETATALMPVTTSFMELGTYLLTQAQPYIDRFGAWFTENLPIIQEQAGAAFGYITNEVLPPLIDAFNFIVENVVPPVQTFFTWLMENLPTLLPIIEGIGIAFLAYQVISGIVQAITGAMNLWRTATMLMTGAQAALNAVMSANPVMLVITLIAMLVGGLVTAYATNEDFRDGVDKAFGKIKEVISNVVETVVRFFTETIPKAGESVVTFFQELPGKIMGFFGGAGEWLSGIGEDIIDGFLGGLRSAWENVTGFIGGIGDWIVQHKGPPAYDKVMLTPAGGYIMDSLANGLESGMPLVAEQVAEVNEALAFGIAATATVSAPTASVKSPTVSAVSRAATQPAQVSQTWNITTGETDASKLARMIARSERKAAQAIAF